MTSKEIIKKVIERKKPPRIGLDFKTFSDIVYDFPARPIYPYDKKLADWGRHAGLLEKTGGFSGDVTLTAFGDIYGRLNGKTNGECIKGALEDGWELLETYRLPELDPARDAELSKKDYRNCDKFVIAGLPCAIFSPLRDSRRMANALMDTILEIDNVQRLLVLIEEFLKAAIQKAGAFGFDAVMYWDDLGTQETTFFSPQTFRDVFKAAYAAVISEAHANGLKVIMHSCGYIDAIIEDLIEIGLDVLQLDQPERYGSAYLAQKYGERIAFYCPVDIQRIMASGNKELIEQTAMNMAGAYKNTGGGLIAMDYGAWADIGVKDEWAQWARDAFIRHADMDTKRA